MNISELEIGQVCTVPLVVISATARETKAKKPYLALELYDGVDKINGNYWDWSGKNIPSKNAILDVRAQVTEWQGVKQLNINGLTTNSDRHITEFMPSSGMDIPAVYKDAYELAIDIRDDFLRNICVTVLEDLQDRWLRAPAATNMHHAYAAGTLIHSFSVAKIARALAETIPGANVELATAGGLLHDLGKLFGYTINGIICEMTDEGRLYDHLFMGAESVGNYAVGLIETEKDKDKLYMLRHIILSHHGKQEYGAVVPPASMEAHIVHHADSIDSVAEMIRAASKKAPTSKWSEKVYALGNRSQISPGYVESIMSTVDNEVALT